jgi:hypothetical protein
VELVILFLLGFVAGAASVVGWLLVAVYTVRWRARLSCCGASVRKLGLSDGANG